MNKLRRKEIFLVIRKLQMVINHLQDYSNEEVIKKLNDILEDIDSILWDEENYRDNIPENMYGGYKYEAADEACDNLSYAIDYMNEAMDGDIKRNLLKAIEHLTNASI